MIRLGYVFRDALQNMQRNVLVVTGAMIAVFISLSLAFGAVVLNELVRINTLLWQEGEQVIVFLFDSDEGISVQDHQVLLADVQGFPEVETARYVDQAEAYQEFLVLFEDSPAILEVADQSDVPASIRVKLSDLDAYTDVAIRLEGNPAVRRIVTPGQAIEQLADLNTSLNVAAIVLVAVQGIAAVVLISNTIRLAIYARRDEVAVMRLVGASNWFIRVPFLTEGVLEGLLGALLGVGAVVLLYNFVASSIDLGLVTFAIENVFFVRWSLIFLAFGGLAGLIGSSVGLRRFLRV
ncbi:MAG: permease-like cell division protein FtsX [Acidimicrobiia bacterium]